MISPRVTLTRMPVGRMRRKRSRLKRCRVALVRGSAMTTTSERPSISYSRSGHLAARPSEPHDAHGRLVELALLEADGLAQGIVGLANRRVQAAGEAQEEGE